MSTTHPPSTTDKILSFILGVFGVQLLPHQNRAGIMSTFVSEPIEAACVRAQENRLEWLGLISVFWRLFGIAVFDLVSAYIRPSSRGIHVYRKVSQRKSVPALPDDCILMILERLDFDTLMAFQQVNKAVRQLIKRNERYLSAKRIAAFPLTPLPNIFSSHLSRRMVLRPDTFAKVRELELRERRIDILFKRAAFLFEWRGTNVGEDEIPPFFDYPEKIKRALRLCDRIADVAANPPCPPFSRHDYEHRRGYRLPPHKWIAKYCPFSNPHARPHQLAHIYSLRSKDGSAIRRLSSLVPSNVLAGSTGEVVRSSRRCYRPEMRDLYISECILRHGTWFLAGCTVGNLQWAERVKDMVDSASLDPAYEFSGELIPRLLVEAVGTFAWNNA
ncbi:hypothetical protein GGS20DRAFT_582122 [Poronia punctata]|nr:hypothetical protein GGS20DRAFT_582122 [Poronia punctata]